MAEKSKYCKICGALVVKGKFCTTCGSIIDGTKEDELAFDLERIMEIKTITDKLRKSILDKLSINSEKMFLQFREELTALQTHLEYRKGQLVSKEKQPKKDIQERKITCGNCGNQVPLIRFCNQCGAVLPSEELIDINELINRVNNLSLIINNFIKIAQKEIDSKEQELVNTISSLVAQFNTRLLAKKIVIEKTAKPVQPVQPTPVAYPTEPVKVEMRKAPTLWSKFEQNLINYWFFYLAIVLFSIGITLTIYFVVLELPSTNNQLIVIYVLGGVIVIIGVIVNLLSRWIRKKKAKKLEEKSDKETEKKNKELIQEKEEKKLPIPQFATIIAFIGFIVLYVAGIVGLGAHADLGEETRAIFLYLSLGIALISIVLGILNKSEMLTITGLVPAIIFTVMDLTWIYPPVMNEITSVIIYIITIIIATLVAIFFNKWWGTAFILILMPITLMVPEVSGEMAFEFVPLILLPLMIFLYIRFNKKQDNITNKRILLFISLLFPTITLIPLSVYTLNINLCLCIEPWWAKIYQFEIFIACLCIVAISYSYRFIQEKYLQFKPENYASFLFSLIGIGIISIVCAAIQFNTIVSSLFFGLFFIIGLVGTLKIMSKYLPIASAVIAFILMEIQAVIFMTRMDISPIPVGIEILYFIFAIMFSLLAIINVFISKVFKGSIYLYLAWSIFAGINVIMLVLMNLIDPWFGFVGVLLLLSLLGIANLPILIPKITNWRIYAITSIFINAFVLTILLFTDNLDIFNYEALVIFAIFVALNAGAFINWKVKEERTVD